MPYLHRLHTRLIEHLNAEIVLGSVASVDDTVKWLRVWFCPVMWRPMIDSTHPASRPKTPCSRHSFTCACAPVQHTTASPCQLLPLPTPPPEPVLSMLICAVSVLIKERDAEIRVPSKLTKRRTASASSYSSQECATRL